MKDGNAIEVKNITKKFKIYHDKGRMLKEKVLFWKRNKYDVHWVLNDISFTVKKGEAIGLIGHNGCGKSTTLKILTGIMYPDAGSVELKGRVSSLLELGAGFHPDMSGRENIYINASIFGLSKKEIDKRINEIIKFSELESYIDDPVRTYSSGMYMRLAFSVAINVDADILLIDEILAVGDVNFQIKCFNKLIDIKKKGTTIVIVSHSMGQIEEICDRSIWIQDGLVKAEGLPREVHKEYLTYMGEIRKENISPLSNEESQENREAGQEEQKEEKIIDEQEILESIQNDTDQKVVEKEPQEDTHHKGTGEARILSVETLNKSGKKMNVFSTDEPITFRVYYEVYKEIQNALFGLSIFRSDGVRCYGSNTKVDGLPAFTLKKGGFFDVEYIDNQLLQGKYYMDICIAVGIDDMVDYYDTVDGFEVYSPYGDLGAVRMRHRWKIDVGEKCEYEEIQC